MTVKFILPSNTTYQKTNAGENGIALVSNEQVVLAGGAVISSSGGPQNGAGGSGIFGSGGGLVLTLAGSVYSTLGTAIAANGGGNTITVGPYSTILGKDSAISIRQGGNAIDVFGWITSSAGTGIAAAGSGTKIMNAGTINGIIGIQLGTIGTGANHVDNSGMILGESGVELFGPDSTLSNSGLIQASLNEDTAAAVKLFTEELGKMLLSNSGTIKGPVVAIRGNIGEEIITNSGIIEGNVILEGGNDFYDGSFGILKGEINLGEGNDTAYGGASNEHFNGGAGKDTFVLASGNDTALGGAGDDSFVRFGGSSSNLTLIGDEGNDELSLQVTVAVPVGANLDASIDLRSTSLQNVGGYWGSVKLNGIEKVTSGIGDDSLIGNSDDNAFSANGGNDTMEGGLGNDVLDGAAGIDTAVFSGDAAAIVSLALAGSQNTGYGMDTLSGIENLTGGAGADRFTGNSGINILTGDAGNDTLEGGLGDDELKGGSGRDMAMFSEATGARVNLTLTDFQPTGYGSDMFLGIEDLSGGAGADRFTGNGSANMLIGNAGNDTLFGGAGNDRLTGGTEADFFVFDAKLGARTNVDTITDFSAKDDTIWLDNSIFRKLVSGSEASPKKLSASSFTVGPKAKDKNDYIVYDKAKGVLYYDADGSGKGAAIKFAQITKGAAITFNDFFVV
jgi:Ca2+-binding RTX toxin-like protein